MPYINSGPKQRFSGDLVRFCDSFTSDFLLETRVIAMVSVQHREPGPVVVVTAAAVAGGHTSLAASDAVTSRR